MHEGKLEHEPEAKRRKLANVHRSKAIFTKVLNSQKYGGSLQNMTEMLLDLELGKERDHGENVTSIIQKLADQKDMFTLHDDDVNGGNGLEKHLVMEARKTEMSSSIKW